jgi:hypothetical protein
LTDQQGRAPAADLLARFLAALNKAVLCTRRLVRWVQGFENRFQHGPVLHKTGHPQDPQNQACPPTHPVLAPSIRWVFDPNSVPRQNQFITAKALLGAAAVAAMNRGAEPRHPMH